MSEKAKLGARVLDLGLVDAGQASLPAKVSAGPRVVDLAVGEKGQGEQLAAVASAGPRILEHGTPQEEKGGLLAGVSSGSDVLRLFSSADSKGVIGPKAPTGAGVVDRGLQTSPPKADPDDRPWLAGSPLEHEIRALVEHEDLEFAQDTLLGPGAPRRRYVPHAALPDLSIGHLEDDRAPGSGVWLYLRKAAGWTEPSSATHVGERIVAERFAEAVITFGGRLAGVVFVAHLPCTGVSMVSVFRRGPAGRPAPGKTALAKLQPRPTQTLGESSDKGNSAASLLSRSVAGAADDRSKASAPGGGPLPWSPLRGGCGSEK
jgi:hypothetical protein